MWGHQKVSIYKERHDDLAVVISIVRVMKTTIVLLAVIGFVFARPQNPNDAYITVYDSDNTGFGDYSYNVETSDGFKHQQSGQLRNAGTDNEILAVQGSYSYIGPDGVTYSVMYIADENGFQPMGEHIPAAASVRKGPRVGIPSAAISSLGGGGLG